MPNIIEPPPPPAFSMSLRLKYWPMAKKMMIGSTQVMKKSKSGEFCSLMSCVNFAPESCRRSASDGSLMMPVRYFFVSPVSVKRIWFS